VAHTQRALQFCEQPQYTAPDYESFCQAYEPNEESRNRFDRDMGYYRFLWLHKQRRGISFQLSTIPALKSKTSVTIPIQAHTVRRGLIQLNDIELHETEPLGLLHIRYQHHCAGQILALPRRYALPVNFCMPGSRQYQQGGMALASAIGDSEEFHSLREYRPGDSPRHIHWPSWAKSGIPLIKEYQDEFFVRQALVLDSFSSQKQQADLFEEAVSVAASFTSTLESGDSLLDLMFVGDQAQHLTVGRSLSSAQQMLETLASIQLCVQQDFTELGNFVLHHAASLSSCVLVLLSWDKQRQDLIQQLLALEVPVLVLLLLPRSEPKSLLIYLEVFS